MNAHSTSLSLWLSLTLYWYNYSSSPHVPLATDEEVAGCLSVPLPCSQDVASGAVLLPAPWWDAAGRGVPVGRPTAISTWRCWFEAPDRIQAGFSAVTLKFSP